MNRDQISEQLRPSLIEQLNELASANHCGAGSVIKAAGRTDVHARLASVDRLACEIELVSVSDPKLSSMSTDTLQSIADRLSEDLSYLEEQLIVLEVDPILSNVQMRSQAPQVTNDTRTYFEVQVGKSGVTLQRFSKEPSTRREQTPAVLTRDVFVRLCIDLVVAVREAA